MVKDKSIKLKIEVDDFWTKESEMICHKCAEEQAGLLLFNPNLIKKMKIPTIKECKGHEDEGITFVVE